MIFSIGILAVIGLMVVTGLWSDWMWVLVQLLCFICLVVAFMSEMLTFGHARKDGADISEARWWAAVMLIASLSLVIWLVLV